MRESNCADQFVAQLCSKAKGIIGLYFILHLRVSGISLILFYDYSIWFESLLLHIRVSGISPIFFGCKPVSTLPFSFPSFFSTYSAGHMSIKYNKSIVVNLLGISLLLPGVHFACKSEMPRKVGGELVLVLPPAISNALTKVSLAAVLDWAIADKYATKLIQAD